MPSASRASTQAEVVTQEIAVWSGGRTPAMRGPGWWCRRSAGRACVRAAEAAAADVVGGWDELLGEGEVRVLRVPLMRIAPYGPIKPAW